MQGWPYASYAESNQKTKYKDVFEEGVVYTLRTSSLKRPETYRIVTGEHAINSLRSTIAKRLGIAKVYS